eukprot:CAMPEP_0117441696 /NCGR_PEP_ID=MMETSP0759-20121206/3766_1 /TAXON_ID=63605 /ORGANISM="Percolomonas cosmopolitus, Strain WS" /LENGTH=635 /DNA_ID=CAMNT_0005233555 /DNA_START=1264 /DNA_END=3171 /DNA_ORIENTATION=-
MTRPTITTLTLTTTTTTLSHTHPRALIILILLFSILALSNLCTASSSYSRDASHNTAAAPPQDTQLRPHLVLNHSPSSPMTDMIAPRPSTPQANQIMQMNTREMQRRDAADDAVRNVEYVPTGNVTSSLKGTWNLLDGHLYSSERKDGVLYLDLEMKERIERQQDASLGHGDYLFVEGELNIRDGEYVTDDLYFFVVVGIFNSTSSSGYFYAFPPPVLLQMVEKLRDLPLPDDRMHDAFRSMLLKKKDEITQKYNRLIEYLALSKYKCIYQSNFSASEMKIQEEPTFVESVFYQDSSVSRFQKARRFYTVKGQMEAFSCPAPNLNKLAYEMETQDSSSYYTKSGYYTVMACAVGFLQVAFLLFQMNRSNTQSTRSRISTMTIGMLGMLDSYAFLLHFTLSIYIPGAYSYISLISFFNFVIFSIFEMKFMLKVWMSSRRLSSDQLRRQASALYTKYYGALFLGIIIIYQFGFVFKYVLMLLYSFWVPQIILNFQKNVPKALHPVYVFGTGITRLIIPLYFFGCPHNFFGTEVNYVYCLLLTSWVFLQSSVLLFQYYFGSRSFIPKLFLPKKYNYKRPIPEELIERGELTCVICYENVDEEDHLVTPCNHLYHEECLKHWMEVKLECPSCRSTIPFY